MAMEGDDAPEYPAANTPPMDAMAVLQPAVLGTFEIFLEDLSFDFSKGTRQRQLDEQLIADLVENYRRVGVLNHDWRYFVIVMVDGDKFRAFAEETNLGYTNWGSAQLIGSQGVKVKGLKKHNGAVLEVQAGQHRLRALERFRREELSQKLTGEILEEQVQDSVSWVAIVLDAAQMTATRLIALELIRLNPEEVRIPDSEGDVWQKWLCLEEIEAKCHDKAERAVLKKNHQIIHRASVGAKVTRRFSRLWLHPTLKPIISRFLRYAVYRATFKSILWECVIPQKRIKWYYESLFMQWEQLLVDAFGSCPEAFDETSFDAIQALPLPRTEKDVRALLYPAGVRSATILSLLSDDNLAETCTSLSSENVDIPLFSFKDLHQIGKTKANTLQELMLHLCRWVDPKCFMEGQSKRDKASAEVIWGQQLNRRARSGIVNKIDNLDVALQGLGAAIVKIVEECGDITAEDLDPETLNSPKEEYEKRFGALGWSRLGLLMTTTFGQLDHGSLKGVKASFFEKKIATLGAKSNKVTKSTKEGKSNTSPKRGKNNAPVGSDHDDNADVFEIPDDVQEEDEEATDASRPLTTRRAPSKTSDASKEISTRSRKKPAKDTAPTPVKAVKEIVDAENLMRKAVESSLLVFRKIAKGNLPKIMRNDYVQLQQELTLLYASWSKKVCENFVQGATNGRDVTKFWPTGTEEKDMAVAVVEDVISDCDEMLAMVRSDRSVGNQGVIRVEDEEPMEDAGVNQSVAKSKQGTNGDGGDEALHTPSKSAQPSVEGNPNPTNAATSNPDMTVVISDDKITEQTVSGKDAEGDSSMEGTSSPATQPGITAPYTQVSTVDMERTTAGRQRGQGKENQKTPTSSLPLRTTPRQLRKRGNADADVEGGVRPTKKNNHGPTEGSDQNTPVAPIPAKGATGPKSFEELNKKIVTKAANGRKKRISAQRPQVDEEEGNSE